MVKLEQTVEFMKNEFLNEEGLLGTAYDADSEGEEGKYYIFEFKDLKEISEIDKYFEISPKGNWENKIILIEKEKPPKRVLDALKQIRLKKKKPTFDSKTQLDLNCLWISSLIAANDILKINT